MKKTQARLRHYLQFKDFSREEYEHLFARTRWIKNKFKRYERYWPLEDRTLAMIFEKPSTRTRLSFHSTKLCSGTFGLWMQQTYLPRFIAPTIWAGRC